MATPKGSLDPIKDVAAAILADDQALRNRVHRLVDGLLAEAERTIKWGSPAERAALMKMVVPSLLRGLETASGEAGDSEEAKAYQRLLRSMGGDTSAVVPE